MITKGTPTVSLMFGWLEVPKRLLLASVFYSKTTMYSEAVGKDKFTINNNRCRKSLIDHAQMIMYEHLSDNSLSILNYSILLSK